MEVLPKRFAKYVDAPPGEDGRWNSGGMQRPNRGRGRKPALPDILGFTHVLAHEKTVERGKFTCT